MAKLMADGIEYEMSFDFDLGEARLIKRYAGISLNELEAHNETDPDLVAAFIHIAMKRRYPDVSDLELEQRVNKVKIASIDMADAEVPTRPPESAPSVPESSASSSGESSGNGAAPTQESEILETSGHPV